MADLITEIQSGGGTTSALLIHSGEEISVPIAWLNQDGSARDMSLATVSVFVRTSQDQVVYTAVLEDVYTLYLSPEATADFEDGGYEIELQANYLNREQDLTFFQLLVGGTLLQSLTLTLLDTSIAHAPISGVTVEVLDPETAAFMAYGVSDNAGHCDLALPGDVEPGRDYEVRTFKAGVHFDQPYTITILDPLPEGSTNDFTAYGTLVGQFGIPSDHRMCRCVGRFMNFQNQPIPRMLVRIYSPSDPAIKVPKVIDGNMVAADAMEFRTDRNGYLVIDLPKGSEYRVTFAGEDDITWNFKVPSVDTTNLIDLIHPQPVSLTWDQTVAVDNSVTISVGQSLVIPVSVLFSDYVSRSEELAKFIDFTLADPTIADGGYRSGAGLDLTGRTVGTTTVTPSMTSATLYPVRIPDYNPVLPVLTVVVTQ